MDLACEGIAFQAEGPATENALLASFVLVLDWAEATRRWAQAVIATNVTQAC